MDALARAPARGFTLIEVMVIVLIVGVVSAALAIATAPGEAAIAEREARRLAALLELAMAESRASGQSMGWSPEGNGYSFWWRTDGGDWARYPDNSVYRSRAFPAKIELANVHVDGREVASGDRVTFSPVGLRSAIRATLSAGNAQIDLRGGVLGRVSTQRLHPD